MNTGIVLSRHGSFQEIMDKMGGDRSFMVERFVVKKYAEKSDGVFVFSHDSKNFEEMFPKNCRHVRFYNAFLYSLFGWIIILYYVMRFRIKILHVESVSGMLSVPFVNKLTSAKVLLDYLYLWHQPIESRIKRSFIMRLESFLLNFADYFIAANKDVRKFVGDRGEILGIPGNSLILDSFRDPEPDKKISGLKGKKLIFIGRLIKIKDPFTLIKSFNNVRGKFPDTHLIICGDGEQRKECENAAGGNVHFMGFAKNIPSLLKASDIFVLPSLFDASPRALVEAMGTGLACIATKVGGVPDYLDESCGILIEPGNEKMLTEKIIYLLSKPDEAKRLGRKARERIFKHYDLEKNIEKEIDFLVSKIR